MFDKDSVKETGLSLIRKAAHFNKISRYKCEVLNLGIHIVKLYEHSISRERDYIQLWNKDIMAVGNILLGLHSEHINDWAVTIKNDPALRGQIDSLILDIVTYLTPKTGNDDLVQKLVNDLKWCHNVLRNIDYHQIKFDLTQLDQSLQDTIFELIVAIRCSNQYPDIVEHMTGALMGFLELYTADRDNNITEPKYRSVVVDISANLNELLREELNIATVFAEYKNVADTLLQAYETIVTIVTICGDYGDYDIDLDTVIKNRDILHNYVNSDDRWVYK